MLSFFKKNLFVILLTAIILIISGLNYTPKTWLSGWDTLHPEFNFPLNFQRIINGVWRTEQGLGTVAGHSHMSDLPRQVILWFFSPILPLSFLRYFYFFACLFLGPLGVYFFLSKIVFKKQSFLEKNFFSFIGSLFYLLNLGTVQHFYVPFEMFATQYAALGWLFFLATQFLQKSNKKTLIFFALVTFLATPQAYAATLWYAYFGCLAIFLFTWLIINKFKNIKSVLLLLGTTLILNAFWLLPNLYYIFQHSGEVLNAKINQLFSQEAFLYNQEYGNLQNAIILKNHLFSWTQFNFSTNKFDLLLKPWLNHLNNPFIITLGYLFSSFVIFGLIMILRKKQKELYPLIPIFFLSLVLLISATPPFNLIFSFLRNHSPLLKEVLRFPFTKFSLILMFIYAVFFAWGAWSLKEIINKIFRQKRIILITIFSLFTLVLLFFAKPAFQGQLINPKMRVEIPNEYFQAFEWFNQQENGRILQLPIHSLWGWEYRNWNFQGAGFTWFGLKQPLLARDFDRWNLKNGKAYQELSYALYSQNLTLFEDLLNKYKIKYLLIDQSLIDPEHDQKVLFLKETESLLALSQRIKKEKDFDFLKIYKIDQDQIIKQNYPHLIDLTKPPNYLINQIKKEIENYGEINFDDFNLKQPTVYKFDLEKLDLQPTLCGAPLENQTFGLKPAENGFILFGQRALSCVKIPLEKIINRRPAKDFLLEVSFGHESEEVAFCLAKWGSDDCLEAKKEEESFYFSFPSNREIKNYEIRFLLETEEQEKEVLIKNIEILSFPAKKELTPIIVDNLEIKEAIKYFSLKKELRDAFSYPKLNHNQSYALLLEAENESGLPLRLCLTNHASKRCDLYENLKNGENIFLIPPMGKEKQGYDVNLSNYAVGLTPSVNLLKSVKIIPLDYEFIKYQQNPTGDFITNNQSYEKNWRAFEYREGVKIKSLGKPVMINGWENGWMLKEKPEGQIIFFFLPQILEYLGFFFILILIVLLLVF